MLSEENIALEQMPYLLFSALNDVHFLSGYKWLMMYKKFDQ
jgi:hypothetical protein